MFFYPCCILIFISFVTAYDDLPNPLIEPNLCNRKGLDHSWICDSSHLLNEKHLDILEQQLTRFRDTTQHTCPNGKKTPYMLVVVVTDNLPPTSGLNTVANDLLYRWGIGACNDGLLLLISTDRKAATFVWGLHVNEGVGDTPAITMYFKQRLISSLENALQHSQNLAQVIQESIESIRIELPVWETAESQLVSKLSFYMLLIAFILYSIGVCLSHFQVKHWKFPRISYHSKNPQKFSFKPRSSRKNHNQQDNQQSIV